MPVSKDTVRTFLGILLIGGVAGLALGSRHMREAQGLARDAGRVIKAARPPAPAASAPTPPPSPPSPPPPAPRRSP